jgi:hypothetical protein
MTLINDAVRLIERAYTLVQRYDETRDAALLDDRHGCQDWLIEAQRVLGNARVDAPRTDSLEPLERIANVLEAVVGETEDGVLFLRVVTGERPS